jgi:nitrate reductase NapAB chaperone NapD
MPGVLSANLVFHHIDEQDPAASAVPPAQSPGEKI